MPFVTGIIETSSRRLKNLGVTFSNSFDIDLSCASCVNPDVHVDVYADEDSNTCKIVSVEVVLTKYDSLYRYTPSQGCCVGDDEVELRQPEVVPEHWSIPKKSRLKMQILRVPVD